MTQYNRYGWGNSDSPQTQEVLGETQEFRSSSRARGFRETSRQLCNHFRSEAAIGYRELPKLIRDIWFTVAVVIMGFLAFCAAWRIVVILADGGAQ